MRATLSRHRRLLAAVLAAAAAALGLAATRPHPRRVPVLVAARDLPGGTALRATDVAVRALPARAVPEGTVRRAAGRTLAGPVRRGEPLTDVRLRGGTLLDGADPGAVATPVRLADAAVVRLLHAGDRVDLLAARAEGPLPARTVAAAVPVLAVPRPGPGTGTGDGALVVLRTDRAQAAAIARAAVDSRLSVAIVG
ncbi:SAF domain-containing protein [Actinoallomurus spadix]|uniref:SAF domain-containing protein n=1 Tax=Actinoallomurus spadix TaxID=79912 RepID=A0ABN0X5T5_9ACTN|nr:SAF domain-containing protein [Actinoallomurus spadix]MCO5986816.1 SAF domain-containing protein [Actinoallomurus spadix]